MNDSKKFDFVVYGASGFTGKPSKTAVTPYKNIEFAVFALKKLKTKFDLVLPKDLNNLILDSTKKN